LSDEGERLVDPLVLKDPLLDLHTFYELIESQ
jgi:hypothetical protein